MLTILNFVATAQTKKENQEIMKRIELDNFDNRMAFEMGSRVIELAKSRNQHIAIEISRLNHNIFLYVDDSLPMDKTIDY